MAGQVTTPDLLHSLDDRVRSLEARLAQWERTYAAAPLLGDNAVWTLAYRLYADTRKPDFHSFGEHEEFPVDEPGMWVKLCGPPLGLLELGTGSQRIVGVLQVLVCYRGQERVAERTLTLEDCQVAGSVECSQWLVALHALAFRRCVYAAEEGRA